MAITTLSSSLATFSDSGVSWRESTRCGWVTAAALLLLLLLQLVSAFRKHRTAFPASLAVGVSTVTSSIEVSSTRSSVEISDADLVYLITNLESKGNEIEKWEDVIEKKNESVSYQASCCKPKDGPLKYRTLTIFENYAVELLRDFYMDNEYRKTWDKTLVEYKQLQIDEARAIEIGCMVKKFPLLTPREYILAWRVWEGKDKTFYCFTKNCDHVLAPRQKKYVRVRFFSSGWRIRKIPGRNACEIAMLHQEDAGLNVDMAKLAFAKGIWSYVCKMSSALHEYSPLIRSCSPSVATMHKLIRKVPSVIESDFGTTSKDLSKVPTNDPIDGPANRNMPNRVKLKDPSKWIANGLLVIGGIACLSRGHSTIGTQIALACILKKLLKHGHASGQAESVQVATSSSDSRAFMLSN
ncbi:hypothetical protein HPP92_018325 [Vanilla planifolia]|uniref:START domain-containing protein n=1 Tax=Vanilla planifolia TaxID=51239 RepID=A0A835Q5I6_VANPL|nr:hypothetical protein HPP92_018325 [Vanilla planifolia]